MWSMRSASVMQESNINSHNSLEKKKAPTCFDLESTPPLYNIYTYKKVVKRAFRAYEWMQKIATE